MQLSPKQDEAIKAVSHWYHNSDEQVFRVFGYAGTGKTTIANRFVEDIDGRVGFAAFTGKAAHVLQRKGCNASTIHRLIYKIIEETKAEREARLAANPDQANKPPQPRWELDYDNSALRDMSLLILDEVSMVGEEMGLDLLSFGKKILVLGDPMQLPPIEGAGFFTERKPDVLLDEVHRQAQDNPIIKIATSIRQQQMPLAGKYGDSIIQHGIDWKLVMESDQLIVGRNATRKGTNTRARILKEFTAIHPVVGDKLVCLRNNILYGLMNGTLWEVVGINTKPIPRSDSDDLLADAFVCDIKDEDGDILRGVQMHREFFTGTEADIPHWKLRKANQFDYGYAITCHKAQGSQWDKVVVADESRVFRENSWRWLYTAVTRAVEKVAICKV